MNTNQSSKHTKRISGVKSVVMWLKLIVLALAFLPLVSAQAGNIIWSQTNGNVVASSFTWTAGAATNWVGGAAPLSTDSAVYVSTNPVNPTIVVDASTSIQDFTITRAAITNSTTGAADTTGTTLNIAAGQTLSVLGPNGFTVQHGQLNGTNGIKMKCIYTFTGNAFVVNNSTATFALNSGVGFNNASATFDTYAMSGLTNLTATVRMFGVANSKLAGGPSVGDQAVQIDLPKTNIVTASRADDYTQLDFTNSIEFARMDNAPNTAFAANSVVRMGISNAFYCDSFGIGRGNSAGNTLNMSMSGMNLGIKNPVAFNVCFLNSNSAAPVSSVIFRNTDKVSRMKLLAIGVDSGMGLTNARNSGILYLVGGKTDMLVDQIWLGRNRTNAAPNGATLYSDLGGFAFDNGRVNANTVIAGYMQFTNIAWAGGLILVGTNGAFTINTNLTLGYTPTAGIVGFEPSVANSYGQMQINNGGAVFANKITVGQYSTNTAVTVNAGGLLVVSNTIASSTNALNFLTLKEGAQLTLFVDPAITNAYVTNFVNGTTPAFINIGSYSGAASYPATNVLITYKSITSPNIQVGTLAPGFNNMQVKNDGAGNIILIVSTNAPKNLVWQGGQNALWDHASANWIDTSLFAPTNITKFTDNDIVTFNDTPGVPVNITIADASVSPASVTVTNWANNKFVFNNDGGANLIASAALTKMGTNSLEINCPSALSVAVNQGSLIGSGSVGSITVASGASMNFAGTDSASLSSFGSATVASGGIISGTVSISAGGVVTNAGTINGTLSSLPSDTVLYNAGVVSAAGSPTISTNATLINAGTIYAGTITVALGGTLIDKVVGTTGLAPGSLNVVQLIVNGAFYPASGAVSTTKITDYSTPSTLLGPPNGRINLNQGSTTYLQVNMDLVGQTNSSLLSQNQGFGGSVNFKSFNGGTLVITRSGAPPYAAGQTFKFFGYYYNDGNLNNAGLNTQNTYPVISPATPGAGLVWDMSQLYVSGTIGVLSATDSRLSYTLTNSVISVTASNIVNDLSWSPDKVGGWLMVLSSTLTNGLSATNWISIGGSYVTNNVNEVFITNNLVGNPNAPGSATFYQFVYPYHP